MLGTSIDSAEEKRSRDEGARTLCRWASTMPVLLKEVLIADRSGSHPTLHHGNEQIRDSVALGRSPLEVTSYAQNPRILTPLPKRRPAGVSFSGILPTSRATPNVRWGARL